VRVGSCNRRKFARASVSDPDSKTSRHDCTHTRSQVFLCWCTFLPPKVDDLFSRRPRNTGCCDLLFLPRCMECRRGLAMRILSVRMSVRLSNAWIVTKRKKNQSRFFIPYERSFSLVFWEKEWLVGGDPFYLTFWVNRPPLKRNRDFEPIIARSASAVTRTSEKVQLTLIGSPLCAFQWA